MADSWLTSFPEMDRSGLRMIRKTLDGAYKSFSENMAIPLNRFSTLFKLFLFGLKNCYWILLGGSFSLS